MKKIVYMGTPDFAVPCLKGLVSGGYEISLVVTQPDKPKGRKRELTPSPVKAFAVENGLKVYQPPTLKSDEAYKTIKSYAPDFIVVAAYGNILPQNILDIPTLGCVNVHGSILPRYRGAAPIQWSVLNGDAETGVTTMLMDAGIDTGDILLVKKTEIGENESSPELFERLAALSSGLLAETLVRLSEGELTPVKQSEAEATYAPMLTKEMSEIDWNLTALQIHNKIRGLLSWPAACSRIGKNKVKLYKSVKTDVLKGLPPGTFYSENGFLFAVCGDGSSLRLAELQAEGGKRMSDSDYLRGSRLV